MRREGLRLWGALSLEGDAGNERLRWNVTEGWKLQAPDPNVKGTFILSFPSGLSDSPPQLGQEVRF